MKNWLSPKKIISGLAPLILTVCHLKAKNKMDSPKQRFCRLMIRVMYAIMLIWMNSEGFPARICVARLFTPLDENTMQHYK